MRKQIFSVGEYYHIYNRGVDKRNIFVDKFDFVRFVESVELFNRVETIGSIRDFKKGDNNPQTGTESLSGGDSKALVAVVAFCLNSNHFHFLLKENIEGGISKFMLKLQSGYTSYFNLKHKRSGSLFQGAFKASHIKGEDYFNKIFGYVNKNYAVHTIPKDKMDLVCSSDFEYENEKFKIVDKKEGKEFLEKYGGVKGFKKHCDEIVDIVRAERGKPTLLEEDNLPDRD